jgi:N-acetylglucosamine-6-phosphate deacetylase
MIVLSGADVVLPDRVLTPGTLVVDGDRIVDVRRGSSFAGGHPHPLFAFRGHYIVPGFIDVHLHGVDGVDVLDAGDAINTIAASLPRHGVTAFCPTTTACAPDELHRVLAQVRAARATPAPRSARVLPAHLESNFINPSYRGAQPAACLRSPREGLTAPGAARPGIHGLPAASRPAAGGLTAGAPDDHQTTEGFTAAEILDEIERAAADVGIVTLASELDGGLDLIGWLTSRGCRVSLGHSAATFDEAQEAIAAGARQATHLFNRMPPLDRRAPGLAGAVLHAEEIAAELICDGVHVHPAMMRIAIAAKRPERVMAITDGTAASGRADGAAALLGGQPITVRAGAAYLDDGTLAGSASTMDRIFQTLVSRAGLSLVDAATVCATTAAQELGLVRHGMLAIDAVADLVVLDATLAVVQTYVGGELVYQR